MPCLARTSLASLFALCLCLTVDAAVVPKVVVPKGVILVKGATPGTSDWATPLPEQGRVAGGLYRNAYFGLSYPIPAGGARAIGRRQLCPEPIRSVRSRSAAYPGARAALRAGLVLQRSPGRRRQGAGGV